MLVAHVMQGHAASEQELQHAARQFPFLEHLFLYQKTVSATGWAAVATFPRLISLRLFNIRNAGLAGLPAAPPPALRSLNMSNCISLSAAGLAHVAEALSGSLFELRLNGCWRVTPAAMAEVARLTALQRLDISGCPADNSAGHAHLKGLPNLRFVKFPFRDTSAVTQ